jgi:hypothetical protein
VNFWATQSLVSGFLSLFVGVYILREGPQRHLNRVFSLFALSLAIWGFSEFGHRHTRTPEIAHLWLSIGGLGWCFMVGLYTHFVLLFSKRREHLQSWLAFIALYVPPAVILVLFLTTDLIYVHRLIQRAWGFTYEPGKLVWTYGAYYFAMYCLTLYLLGQVLRNGTISEKRQAGPIILGTSSFVIIASATNLLLPFFHVVVPELGTIASILCMSCMVFAIRKHKLFVIEPVSEVHREKRQRNLLPLGMTHFIREEGVDKSYEIFKDQLQPDVFGLCFSKLNPEKVRERYSLKTTPVVWIHFNGKNEKNASPMELDSIESAIRAFLNDTTKSAILIDCYNELRLANGFQKAKVWLSRIGKAVQEKNSVLLVTASPLVFEPEELKQLEKILE